MGSFGSWASIAMVVALAISGCSSTEEGASSSILNLPTGPTNDPLLKTGESPRDLARRTPGSIRDILPCARSCRLRLLMWHLALLRPIGAALTPQ